jgi:hypothetical protein
VWYQSYWRKPPYSLRPWYVPFALPFDIMAKAFAVLDWNPAADQQALARVWRDGQKKECKSAS